MAESVQAMGLRYATVTGVTRDDLPDGGAAGGTGSANGGDAGDEERAHEARSPRDHCRTSDATAPSTSRKKRE